MKCKKYIKLYTVPLKTSYALLRTYVLDMWIYSTYTVSIWSTEFKLLYVSADNIAYCQLAYFSLRV
jgi:hypothetical protein